jgi:hypothetical protein
LELPVPMLAVPADSATMPMTDRDHSRLKIKSNIGKYLQIYHRVVELLDQVDNSYDVQ